MGGRGHGGVEEPVTLDSALTRLDHNRALGQLAEALDAPADEIDGLAIWGNHSATQFPDVSYATVRGEPVLDALAARLGGRQAADTWLDDVFIPRVARRGAEIIDVRGSSSVASAAVFSTWGIGVQGLARLGYTVLIGRAFGTETLGHASALMSLSIFVALLWPTAAGNTASRFVALALHRSEPEAAVTKVLGTSMLVSSVVLGVAAAVPLPSQQVVFEPSWSAVAGHLAERAKPGDVVITCGAGDVTMIGPEVLARLEPQPPEGES